jgi:hypothetical protein
MPCNIIAQGAWLGSCYCLHIFNLETILASFMLSQCAFVSYHPLVLMAITSQKPKEGRDGAHCNTPPPLDTAGLASWIEVVDNVCRNRNSYTAG